MLLIFIRAHALLHRENRQKSPEGSIIATLEEDYEKVADLLREPISEAAGTSVPKNVRRVIQGVEELLKADPKGSIRSLDLAAHLGIDRGSCSRNVNQAIELGYLVNDRARGSKASELRLGKPIPDIMSILPRASDLTDSDWRIGTD
jgi:uncharacterized protein (UPF0147 family)